MRECAHMHPVIQNRYISGEDFKDLWNTGFPVKFCGLW